MKNFVPLIRRILRLVKTLVPSPLKTPEQAWTEYLSWLSFANAGMLARGNVACFDYALANLPGSGPIVEIGSFCGLSTNVITYLMKKHNIKEKLISCDKWLFEGAEKGHLGDSNIPHSEYRDFVRESYIRNIKMFSRDRLPYTIEMFSDDFFQAWAQNRDVVDILKRPIQLGGPIAFCYIDGNHSYENARRDFVNCDRYLQKGGFIFFDDSAGDFGVAQLMPEVAATGRYKLITQNPNHFFQKTAD